MLPIVKKALALFFAVLSGIYLLTLGIMPDPLPFLDEATALLIFVQSMSVLGIDLRRFIPFLPKRGGKGSAKQPDDKDRVIDV